ncbi:MAG: outer membrane beta-barrel protein [Sphingomonas phyllosphaerae]|uniref:outer membrane protein n=1 Tax=Sphingomonas phyllosphaerae TaxID=257003 RepID=UPI002FF939A6
MMKSILAACVACAAFASSPAVAQDRTFTGPSVSAIIGIDHNRESDNRTGAVNGGQVGYDVQAGGLVIGAEAELTGSTSKGCRRYQGTAPVSTNIACEKALRDLYIGGRIGTVVGGSTLIYGKVGYTNARTGSEFTYSATPAYNFAGGLDSDGVRVGGGIEKRLGGGLSVKAEYRYSNYEGLYSRHQGVLGIGFRF